MGGTFNVMEEAAQAWLDRLPFITNFVADAIVVSHPVIPRNLVPDARRLVFANLEPAFQATLTAVRHRAAAMEKRHKALAHGATSHPASSRRREAAIMRILGS